MLNLILTLRENFDLIVRPLKLNIFQLFFHVLCFIAKGTVQRAGPEKFQICIFLTPPNLHLHVGLWTNKSIS